MSDEMSSKNSNNSDIEVIGPEDLEESPPPQDDTEPGSEAAGDTPEAAPETKEVIKSRTKSDMLHVSGAGQLIMYFISLS